MKNFLRPLSVLTAFVVFFSSCSKKDSTPGSVSYDGKTYGLSYGEYLTENSGNYSQLILSNVDPSAQTMNGSVTMVAILMDPTAVTAGTYTYLRGTDDNYDGTKNFFDASAYIDVKLSNGSLTGEGTFVEGITAGTVTITKSGSGYTVAYSLTFGDKTMTGKFTGAIKAVSSND